AAPRRPEVDQHRLTLRLLDHVLHEGLGGRLLDETIRGRCRRGRVVLQHGVDPSTPQGPNVVQVSGCAIKWWIRRANAIAQRPGNWAGQAVPDRRPGRGLTPERRAPQPARSAANGRGRRGTERGRRARTTASWW